MVFDVNKSRVSENALATFLASPLTGDLQEVPGVGPTTQMLLMEKGINNTYQLIGTFLIQLEMDDTPQQKMDKFWEYLKECGINSFRSGITHAIGEKISIMFPSMFD